MLHLIRQTATHEWCFQDTIPAEFSEIFYDGMEALGFNDLETAESCFRKVLRIYPSHIDSLHHLGYVLGLQMKEPEAMTLKEKAVEIGNKCFHPEFVYGKDRLQWGVIENRPYLRACHVLALAYQETGRISRALSMYNRILVLNPNDNQGVRALAAECYLEMQKPDGVIMLCQDFPDDTMNELLYGLPLAYFKIKEKAKAKRALLKAFEINPLLAERILSPRRGKIKKHFLENYGMEVMGGEVEARSYINRSGKFWKQTKGAKEFLKDVLEAYKAGKIEIVEEG